MEARSAIEARAWEAGTDRYRSWQLVSTPGGGVAPLPPQSCACLSAPYCEPSTSAHKVSTKIRRMNELIRTVIPPLKVYPLVTDENRPRRFSQLENLYDARASSNTCGRTSAVSTSQEGSSFGRPAKKAITLSDSPARMGRDVLGTLGSVGLKQNANHSPSVPGNILKAHFHEVRRPKLRQVIRGRSLPGRLETQPRHLLRAVEVVRAP